MSLTRRWLSLALAALLAACLPPTPDSPTQAPASTGTPTAAPSATVTPPPTAAATSKPADTPTPEPSPTPLASNLDFLDRPGPASLRVMSYNINWDSIFPPDDPQNHDLRSASYGAAFRRIVAAVRPDVLCLQEINPARDPAHVSALLEETLAPDGQQDWTAASTRDSVIAARFPVRAEGAGLVVPPFPQELAQPAALVDLPDDVYGALDLYVICAHFKAGGNVYDRLLRQRQADVIMRQVGDALTPGGNLDLPEDTPLVILGDFNIYTTEAAEHLNTLLTGDIDHEDQYGPDVQPDWDGTALADALPSHNGLGADFYTWRDDGSPLPPGSLDRILFSDSVLAVQNAFVLNPTLLTEDALAAAGLEADDVLLAPAEGYYDHLPLVVDFELK